MKKTSNILSVGLVLMLAAGCGQEFNPKGTYEQKLVLYSVLSTRSDSQFVRLYATYNPSGHNPLENTSDTQVPNARVTLELDGSPSVLGRLAIPRNDKSRYSDDIQLYLAHPYAVQYGKKYTLRVSSDQGSASATVTVPGRGDVAPNNYFVLKEPEKYDEDISMKVRVSSSARGYLARIILEFETRLGTTIVRHREEIPRMVYEGDGIAYQFEYPTLVRKSENPFQVYEIVNFKLDAYRVFLIDLLSRYGDFKLTGAWFILTQVDPNLFTYFNVANGFLDEYSIRTDLPDFDNITGGVGVFGAMVEDSAFADLGGELFPRPRKTF